ncbi:protein indeterminate-domain 12-like isoform X2 [Henckelia pumila]
MSNNSTCVSEEASTTVSSGVQNFGNFSMNNNSILTNQEPALKIMKKKRNLPGNPDPDAEVIALSPRTLLATNRYVCEVCKKGFQRDQNLQLHRRGHNLPWKLKQRISSKDQANKKKAYVCPETTCVHHHPSRALGDLTGIKKHYSRKHGEKKWKCEKCSKIYAVQSDWKAHSKTCGTREYKCDCGTIFSRKDSFITHRAFCDALAQESARLSAATLPPPNPNFHNNLDRHETPVMPLLPLASHQYCHNSSSWDDSNPFMIKPENLYINPFSSPLLYQEHNLMVDFSGGSLSATALLQKAATTVAHMGSNMAHLDLMHMHMHGAGAGAAPAPGIHWHNSTSDNMTRDFLGLKEDQCGNGELVAYNHGPLLKHQGTFETYSGTWGNSC